MFNEDEDVLFKPDGYALQNTAAKTTLDIIALRVFRGKSSREAIIFAATEGIPSGVFDVRISLTFELSLPFIEIVR
jgi:hypothetical protein